MKIPSQSLAFCESSDHWFKMPPRSYDLSLMMFKCLNDIKINEICYAYSIVFL